MTQKKENPRKAELVPRCFATPSKAQFDFCFLYFDMFRHPVTQNAATVIMSAYLGREEVHPDYINIVDEMIRQF